MTSTASPLPSLEPSPRILLVRLSAIGDCLHAVPVAVELRRQLPTAYIGWAIERAGAELLGGLPAIDRFHLYPRSSPSWSPASWPVAHRELGDFRRELRAAAYDVALDLQGLTKSGLVSFWSRARRRVGFAGAESRELNQLFVNHRQPIPTHSRHIVERNLAMLAALGLEVPAIARWEMPGYQTEGELVDRYLGERGLAHLPFAVVNPGTTWRTKTWPAASFARFARRMVDALGLGVIVTWGTAQEEKAARQIASGDGIHLAPATDLRQLAALVRRACLFVGNDTGPLHLAVALGVPSVAIFGATDPGRNGPYGPLHRVVVADAELDCRPCSSQRCRRGDLACLSWIEPEQVLATCAELAPMTCGARRPFSS